MQNPAQENSAPKTPVKIIATERLNFGTFLKSEIHGLFGAFWRGLYRTALVVGLVIFVLLAWSAAFNPAHGQSAETNPLFYLFLLGYCLYIGSMMGLGVGVFAVCWRMAGWATLAPLILVPMATFGAIWTARHILHAEGMEFIHALQFGIRAHNWTEAPNVGKAAVIPPGAIIQLIFYVMTIPAWGIDLVTVILTPMVFREFVTFVAAVFVAGGLGFFPSALVSVVLLGVAFVLRFRGRMSTVKTSAARTW